MLFIELTSDSNKTMFRNRIIVLSQMNIILGIFILLCNKGNLKVSASRCHGKENMFPLPKARVVNGNYATEGLFPFVAIIGQEHFLFRNRKLWFFCAGSLITDRFVLSAGHCMENTDISKLYVRLGSIVAEDIKKDNEQEMKVDRAISHNEFQYFNTSPVNDVLLLRLSQPAQITGQIHENNIKGTDFVRPIFLPVFKDAYTHLPEGSVVTTAGYGNDNIPRNNKKHALKYYYGIIDTSKNNFTELADWTFGTQILSEYGIEEAVSCTGDSGGPVFVSVEATAEHGAGYIQYGIVSFSPKKFTEKGLVYCPTPAVSYHADVSYFILWIKEKISENL